MINLHPAPRKLPLSLKLSLIFGNKIFLMLWSVLAFLSWPVLYKLNQAFGGFHYDPAVSPMIQAPILLLPLVFLAVGLGLFVATMKAGKPCITLLEKGAQTWAALINKTDIPMPDIKGLRRVTFEYEVDGRKYRTWLDDYNTARLENKVTPILFDPHNPKQAVLLNALPARIGVDEGGNLRHRRAFMGFVYPFVPLTVLAGMVYFAWR